MDKIKVCSKCGEPTVRLPGKVWVCGSCGKIVKPAKVVKLPSHHEG